MTDKVTRTVYGKGKSSVQTNITPNPSQQIDTAQPIKDVVPLSSYASFENNSESDQPAITLPSMLKSGNGNLGNQHFKPITKASLNSLLAPDAKFFKKPMQVTFPESAIDREAQTVQTVLAEPLTQRHLISNTNLRPGSETHNLPYQSSQESKT